MKNLLAKIQLSGYVKLLASVTICSLSLPVFSAAVAPNAANTTIPIPFNALSHYMVSASADYSIQDWAVSQPSPIQWASPRIVMEPDITSFYGFHRYGKVGGWQVKAYGPRAGVDVVQFLSPKPVNDLKRQFEAKGANYSLHSCNSVGNLLKFALPSKKPVFLFAELSRLILFPSQEPPTAETLQANKIAPLKASANCHL